MVFPDSMRYDELGNLGNEEKVNSSYLEHEDSRLTRYCLFLFLFFLSWDYPIEYDWIFIKIPLSFVIGTLVCICWFHFHIHSFILLSCLYGWCTFGTLPHALCSWQITTLSGQDVVCLGNYVFRGKKQVTNSTVYKQVFYSLKMTVFLATNFFIPASFS